MTFSAEPFRCSDGRAFEGFLNAIDKQYDNKDKIINSVNEKLAQEAANYIYDSDVVGLGSGPRVVAFIKNLAKRCEDGLRITAVTISNESYDLARSLGLNVFKIREIDTDENFLDVYVGGADEVDENFYMIKGGVDDLHKGKVLAMRAKKVIIMINNLNQVKLLGNYTLAVEVSKIGSDLVKEELSDLGYNSEKRRCKDGSDFVTDNNNYIFDVELPKLLEDPKALNKRIKNIIGVVDTVFFVDLVDQLLVGYEDRVETINAKLVKNLTKNKGLAELSKA